MHEDGGRWVGSNKVVELKKRSKRRQNVGNEGARGLKRLSSSTQGDFKLIESGLGSFQARDKR